MWEDVEKVGKALRKVSEPVLLVCLRPLPTAALDGNACYVRLYALTRSVEFFR